MERNPQLSFGIHWKCTHYRSFTWTKNDEMNDRSSKTAAQIQHKLISFLSRSSVSDPNSSKLNK